MHKILGTFSPTDPLEAKYLFSQGMNRVKNMKSNLFVRMPNLVRLAVWTGSHTITYFLLCSVEHIKKIEEIIHAVNRDNSVSIGPSAKGRFMEIEKELELLAMVASLHEQRMAQSKLLLRSRIEMLESLTNHGAIIDQAPPSESVQGKNQSALDDPDNLLWRTARASELEICRDEEKKVLAEMLKSIEVHREHEALWKSEKEMFCKKIGELDQKSQKDVAKAFAELSSTKQKANALIQQKELDLTEARKKIAMLEKEAAESASSAKDLRQRISVLEQNKLLLAKDANAAQSAKQQEEKARMSLEQNFWRVGVLEKESVSLQASLDRATKQMQEIQVQFKKRVAALTKEKESVASELAQVKLKANSVLGQKSDEAAMLRRKLDEAEVEIARLQKVNRSALVESVSDLEISEIRRKANDIIALKSEEICRLNKKLEQVEKELNRLNSDCVAFENRRKSLEKNNLNLSKEIVHLLQEKKTVANEKEGLISQLALMKKDTAKSKEKEKLMERTVEALRASQVTAAKELQELRGICDKLRITAAIREKELQAALEVACKQAKEASTRDRDNAAMRDKEKLTAAAELAETKRKANSLLSQKSEELMCARAALDKVEREVERLRAEHQVIQMQWTGKIKEKENECGQLLQKARDLAEVNARLAQQSEFEKEFKSSSTKTLHPKPDGNIDASRSSLPLNHFDQTLLRIRMEALEAQNASLESEKQRLLKSLVQLQQSQSAINCSNISESKVSKEVACGHQFGSQPVQVEVVPGCSDSDQHNCAPDNVRSAEHRTHEISEIDNELIGDLQSQLRDAQLARDSAFKVMDIVLDSAESLSSVDSCGLLAGPRHNHL